MGPTSYVYYVEIKYQLDATDEFLLQISLLAQHVSGTFMPIIRSSRVLYKWLLSVVFGAVKKEIVISTQYRRCTVKTTSNHICGPASTETSLCGA
jgi:hypothetical protein